MVLIGEYTQLPDWLPVQAGSGILALERDADGLYREAGVCPTENPSYLVPGGGDCFFAVQEGGQGGLVRCKKTADGAIAVDNTLCEGPAMSALTAGRIRPMWQTMSPAR